MTQSQTQIRIEKDMVRGAQNMNLQGFTIAPTSSGAILDYRERNDLRTYESDIREFYEKYDMDATNLNTFIVAFANKAQKTGRNSLNNAQAGTDNLITKYGVIPLERVKSWAMIILSEQSRGAQDENMMYHSLVASLSNEGQAKLYLRSEDTTVQAGDNGILQSGLVAFKVIPMEEAGLRKLARVVHLKMKLTKLTSLISTHTYNIKTFNDEINYIILDLAWMNEKANDLILYLFPAYMEAPDKDFRLYIRSLKDNYTEEGLELTPTSLMDKAAHKYQNLVDSGSWKAPSESEKKLLALSSKIEKLQAEKKGKRKEGGSEKNGKEKMVRFGKDTKGKDKDQKGGWKSENPGNLKTTKKVKNRTYHWRSVKQNGAPEGCGCNKFILHKPKNCQGKAWKERLDAKKAGTLKVQEAISQASNGLGDE